MAHHAAHIDRRPWFAASGSVCVLSLLSGSGCLLEGYTELCRWEHEIDVSTHVGDLEGDWREIPQQDPLIYAQLLVSGDSLPRFFNRVHGSADEALDLSRESSDAIQWGCAGPNQYPLVRGEPNRVSGFYELGGQMLVDVDRLSGADGDGQGYVLEYSRGIGPGTVSEHDRVDFVTIVEVVDQDTLTIRFAHPDSGNAPPPPWVLRRTSEVYPTEAADRFGPPDP